MTYSAGYAYPPPVAAKRRRRRWPWVLLVLLLVLGGLFTAGDRIALAYSENRAATTLETSQHLSSKPDVDVGGFPFLTQLLAKHLDEVTVRARDIPVGPSGRPLLLHEVDLHLSDVTFPWDFSWVRAKTATADSTIDFADLSKTLGVPVKAGADGRIIASPSVSFAGQRIGGQVSAIVHASAAGGITFTDPKVTVDGAAVPDVVSKLLAAVLTQGISLAGLPFDIAVDGVRVDEAAVHLSLSGRNLYYAQNS